MQKVVYILSRSPANSAASPPPTPGRISRRQGRSAKGCLGTSAAVRALEAVARSAVAVSRSSVARAQSSGSEEGSVRRECSSVRESLALSYWLSAVVIGVSSPKRFAVGVEYAVLRDAVRRVCSVAVARARRRRAGDIVGGVAEDDEEVGPAFCDMECQWMRCAGCIASYT